MIATAVPDPRRAYDRGVWAGEPANRGSASASPAGDSPTGIAGVSTEALVREIERRKQRLKALHGQRDRLLRQVAALDAEIRDLDDEERPAHRAPQPGTLTGARTKTPRSRDAGSLRAALAAAVPVGQVVSPADAARMVQAQGYRTASKAFAADVSRALAQHSGFARRRRGQYVRVV